MFGEVEAIAERFIEKATSRGFEDAAIVLHAAKRFMAKYANSLITVVQSWTDIDAEVLLARRERVYNASIAARSPEQLEKLVERVDQVIETLDKSKLYAPLPEPTGKPLQGLADRRLANRLEDIGSLAEAIINRALEVAGEEARVAGMIEAIHGHRYVATSRGARLGEEHTMLTGYARVILGDASGHWAWTGRTLEEKMVESIGGTAADYAVRAANTRPVQVERGKYTAILSPLVAGDLVTAIGFMASGLAALMGFSFLAKHRPGDRVGAESVTIIDDPHAADLPFSTGFDDEGVATERKPIIEKGVFQTLLHNSKTGRLMGSKSTGNAGLVFPHPWNLVVEPGDMELEEMIAETKRGFLVNNNWYTRFQNYYEGVFSTVTRDALLYIENGEIVGRVERLRIASTLPSILEGVRGAGRKAYNIKWWEVTIPVKTPYILVDGVEFTLPEA